MSTTTTNPNPSYPSTLHTLPPTTTTLITDALHRAVLALDTNNLPLWHSAFTQHSSPPTFTLFGTTHAGQAALDANVFFKVNRLDTTHFISNVRVSGVSDDDVTKHNDKSSDDNGSNAATRARLTASAQAYHYRPGEGAAVEKTDRLVSGSLYELEVVKEGEGEEEGQGQWRIAKWEMRVVWLEGERSVMESN